MKSNLQECIHLNITKVELFKLQGQDKGICGQEIHLKSTILINNNKSFLEFVLP